MQLLAKYFISIWLITHRFLLNKPNIQNIVRDASPLNFKWRLLLLNIQENNIPAEITKIIQENSTEVELKDHEIKLDYNSLDYYQVMRQLLPNEIEVPQPLEKIGHIACFYLTSKQYLYRELIAQVYLDKNNEIKTIVNRGYNPISNNIQTEFILGEKKGEVKIKDENLAELCFDYINSNYTSRMEEEHKRILHYVNMNYTVMDLLADCGAVTVRAAKKGCRVISNCENSNTYKYLEQNITNNLSQIPTKLEKVKAYNLPTNEFIKSVLGPNITGENGKPVPDDFKRVNVIYINDYFNAFGYIKEILKAIKSQCENILNDIWSVRNLPKIYFYYSGGEKSTKASIVEKLKQSFIDAGCGSDTFTEKCIIGIKANRYIYPDICLHCVYIRIPASAVFSTDYMDMYGSQELSIPNPGSICSLSIGDTLEMLDEMKIPTKLSQTVVEIPKKDELKGKRKESEHNENPLENDAKGIKKKAEEK